MAQPAETIATLTKAGKEYPVMGSSRPQPLPASAFALEPIVSLDSGLQVGRELLCRHSPFPQDARAWRNFYARLFVTPYPCATDNQIAFNLDTRHILDEDIWEATRAFLRAQDPRQWIVEWTEHPEGDHTAAAGRLRDLHQETGVSISIDDLGAGQDGFSRLSDLGGAQWVKIDGNLFHAARNQDFSQRLIQKLCEMIRDMGAILVMEWIETEADLDLATQFGADCGQGYWFTQNREREN